MSGPSVALPDGGDPFGGLSIATASDLTNLHNVLSGAVATLRGYASDADGGGGQFYWSSGDTTPSDGALVVGDSIFGRWRRLRVSKEVNVKWFGAKGDGVTDDAPALNRAYAACTSLVSELIIPAGTYFIGSPLQWDFATTGVEAIRITGECGGAFGLPGTTLKFGLASPSGIMVRCAGRDFLISNIRFADDVPGTASTGVALGSPSDVGAVQTSNVRFVNCRWSGFRWGCDVGTGVTGGVDFTQWSRCYFNAFDAGIRINGGQPLGMSIDDTTFSGLSADVMPHNRGIYFQNHYGAAMQLKNVNFSYLCTGIDMLRAPAELVTIGGDSENTKRLLNNFDPSAKSSSFKFVGCRYVADAIYEQRVGSCYSPSDSIAFNDNRYFRLRSGNLLLEGINFLQSFDEENFRIINYANECHVIVLGCAFATKQPFERVLDTLTDGLGNYRPSGTLYAIGNTGVKISEAGATGDVRVSMPNVYGAENPSGMVTISGTSTFADVVFANVEATENVYSDTAVSYQVTPAAEVPPGSTPVVTQPYISLKKTTGFRINLPSAPGIGQSLRVSYKIWR